MKVAIFMNYINKKNDTIYMDNAATTPICETALEAMRRFEGDGFANPSSDYKIAKEVRKYIEKSRGELADIIKCQPEEIYFTSGGTEADNWAIEIPFSKHDYKGEIISSPIEHHAVINKLEAMKMCGCKIKLCNVASDGIVDVYDLNRKVNDKTKLITVMMINNEIGTIQPVMEIGEIARRNNVLFHTDAVAAFGHIKIDLSQLKVDMLSASGHKFGAPKGVGFLFVRNEVKKNRLVFGGSQERGMRAGTENVIGIAGMVEAAKQAYTKIESKNSRIIKLRDYMELRIKKEIKNVKINGSTKRKVPGNLNVSIKDVDGFMLVKILDAYGICISAGSACNSSVSELSHVIRQIEKDEEYGRGAIRFTLSERNTFEEVNYVVRVLKEAVTHIRKIK